MVPDAGKAEGGVVLHPSSGGCSSASLNQTSCPCTTIGQTVDCYTGPPGTRGIGSCKDGTQVCTSRGEFNAFGPCTGQVLPSSPTACGSFAAPPDASGVAEGAPCQVGQVLPGPDAGANSGFGNQVWYCDSIGTWGVFPSGGCTPAACLACMQANCMSAVTDSLASCSSSLTTAFNWLAQCGPDRSNYFQSLGAPCSDRSVEALESCKDTLCVSYTVGDGGVTAEGGLGTPFPLGAPCSFY